MEKVSRLTEPPPANNLADVRTPRMMKPMLNAIPIVDETRVARRKFFFIEILQAAS